MARLMFNNCPTQESRISCCFYVKNFFDTNSNDSKLKNDNTLNLIRTNTAGEIFLNLSDKEKNQLKEELSKLGANVSLID